VIAAVDCAGHAADYDALQPIADGIGAKTLDDAAHSVGGTYKGRPVGDLADVTTLGDRLRAEAKRRGRPAGDVRREFVFQRFLARMFSDPQRRHRV
jgi:hypothetical protein